MQSWKTHMAALLPPLLETPGGRDGALWGSHGSPEGHNPYRMGKVNACTTTVPGSAAACDGKCTWHRGHNRGAKRQRGHLAALLQWHLARREPWPRLGGAAPPWHQGLPISRARAALTTCTWGLECGTGRGGGYSCREAWRRRCL